MVLITGASGGLGRALVAEFLAQGWRVVAAGHQTLPPMPAGERGWPLRLDVTDAEQVRVGLEKIQARWDRLDALINNAGLTADQLLSRASEADWDRVLSVNLRGAFLCARAALPMMLRQRAGHIVQLSSFAARYGTIGQSNYAAAKAGLLGFTQALAKEVGARNIRVNAVLPGVLATAMTAQLTVAQRKHLAAENALGRLNSVAEVARFVAFLVALEDVSGQVFQLDSRVARWT